MANVEFFTGFEGMGTTADLYTLFESIGTGNSWEPHLDLTNGYDDSKCLHMQAYFLGLHGCSITKEVISDTIKVVGFHCKILQYGDYLGNGYVLKFNGPEISVWSVGGGTGIYVKDETGTLENSGGIGIPHTMSHLEVKVVCSSTNGYVGVKLNGILVIDYNGPTSNNPVTSISIGCPVAATSVGQHAYIDNLFIADDWVGECRTALKLPMQDVIAEFEPSNVAAYNYEMVDDEGGHDSDSTYNETDESAMDLFEFQDLDENVIVRAVNLVAVARKTDVSEYPVMLRFLGHDGDLTADSTDSSGILYNEYLDEMYYGNEWPLDTVYPQALNAGYYQCFAQAPNGSAWTRDIFNEYLWGYWGRVPTLATGNFDGKVKLIENLTFDGKAVIE